MAADPPEMTRLAPRGQDDTRRAACPLLAAERRNPDFLALHDELTAARIRPIVPVVVLAQAWRGAPQHQISHVLKGCDILPRRPPPRPRRRPRLRRLGHRLYPT